MLKISTALIALTAAGTALASGTLRFDESALAYEGGAYVSNFGSREKIPAPDEKEGYVLYLKDGKVSEVIGKEAGMVQPTAMARLGESFFVCDRDRIHVFTLKEWGVKTGEILFPPEDTILNDMVLSEGYLYVTVTNTDRVYRVNVKKTPYTPEFLARVPSPNGIDVRDGRAYIVSIPADYATPHPENVVYYIADVEKPFPEPLNTTARLYDGAALSSDGRTLYVSDWISQAVIALDLNTGEEKTVYTRKGLTPADIAVEGDTLWIPDLVHHQVIEFNLKDGSERRYR